MSEINVPDELLTGQLKTVILYIIRSDFININNICFTDDEYKHIYANKGKDFYKELVKDDKILIVEESKYIGKYNPESDFFIDKGGYTRDFLVTEFEIQSQVQLTEFIQKDLLLRVLKYLKNRFGNLYDDQDISTNLFKSKIDRHKVRQYIDELSEDGYITQYSDKYTVSYHTKADKFLERGGYIGEYYRALATKRDSKPTEKQRRIERKKNWLNEWKVSQDYLIKRYLYPIFAVLFVLMVALIVLNLVFDWDWLPYNNMFKLYDAYRNGELEEVTKELFQ